MKIEQHHLDMILSMQTVDVVPLMPGLPLNGFHAVNLYCDDQVQQLDKLDWETVSLNCKIHAHRYPLLLNLSHYLLLFPLFIPNKIWHLTLFFHRIGRACKFIPYKIWQLTLRLHRIARACNLPFSYAWKGCCKTTSNQYSCVQYYTYLWLSNCSAWRCIHCACVWWRKGNVSTGRLWSDGLGGIAGVDQTGHNDQCEASRSRH